ncbi:MAG TPA: sigma-54 dependent transcriptional regulator [Vicinamibacterales bacterium]|nr:sigma-54 dependent transcriptional regulator [Vicinamibacterales bacterium]
MRCVAWVGKRPASGVAQRLSAAGIQIDREDPEGLPLVVATATGAKVPAPGAERGRWLWVSAAPVPAARAADAVLRGAYDVVALGSHGAADTIVSRLEEMLAPEPVPPAADHIAQVSAASRAVLRQAARVAQTAMAVLLTGETGTGKEVTARQIHAWSPRRDRRFVPINCAAIPNELMEAELFGYARGAFSGAVQAYDGQLMAAAGGTVFLDEIDDTPLETQVKLLRVLEDRVVSRLGENAWHEVDFRILAATNRDLEPLVASGRFGADLYERLAIVRIHLAPLRERIEDLPKLAQHFLDRFAQEHQRPKIEAIRADTLRALTAYPWPGNIRELRNVMFETMVYKRAGRELLPADLPLRILRTSRHGDHLVDHGRLRQRLRAGQLNLRDEVRALERDALAAALEESGGNAAQAARLLGTVGRGTSRDPGGTVRAMKRRLGYRG